MQRVCVFEGNLAKELAVTVTGQITAIDWGPNPDEVFVSFCDPERGPQARCPLALTTVDGQLIHTYPEPSSPALVETDGRWTNWLVSGPRASPDGTNMAVSISGHHRIVRLEDGVSVAELPPNACERVWSPDGRRVAYTRGSGSHPGCATETQVFLYDLVTSQEMQLTHFEAQVYRPWWNPFAEPIVRPPLVAGLSWARRGNVLLFNVVPDRGAWLMRPDGEKIGSIKRLEGECWRSTQLSADGHQIIYLSASRSDLCLANGGDEIRLVNDDGSNDRIVISTTDKNDVISDIDWMSD